MCRLAAAVWRRGGFCDRVRCRENARFTYSTDWQRIHQVPYNIFSSHLVLFSLFTYSFILLFARLFSHTLILIFMLMRVYIYFSLCVFLLYLIYLWYFLYIYDLYSRISFLLFKFIQDILHGFCASHTSSSAVAKRLRDASCLSVVSFNSTERRVESFIVSYIGYRFITAST